MMPPRMLLAAPCLVLVASALGCSSGPGMEPLTGPSATEAFGTSTCNAVRPQTEPDLMGWDSASRANLARLRNEGVIAVRYSVQGCNVELELLSNCIGDGKYTYSPYSANESKTAHNASELFAQLPVGAAGLSTKLRGSRALRTDYMLVGTESLPVSGSYKTTDLKGTGCERATHVVSTIYTGGFAMVAGEASQIEGGVRVFSAGGGASTEASFEHVAREGQADACAKAQAEGTPSPLCSVPLRIGLREIEGRVIAPVVETPSAVEAPSAAEAPPVAAPWSGEVAPSPSQAAPSATATGSNARFSWAKDVVVDKKTGLSWYRKTLRAKTWQDAHDVTCSSVTAAGGGFLLATLGELKGLVDRSKGIPPFDREAFPEIELGATYLSDTATNAYPDIVETIQFDNGGTDSQNKGYGGNVLCTRKGDGSQTPKAAPKPSSDASFTLTAGTAKDKRTGLTWLRRDLGDMKNTEAIVACSELVFEGKGWRLPDKTELATLVELGRGSPTINRTVFPGTRDSTYVSSTPSSPGSLVYWNVSFSNGLSDTSHNGYGGYVRCVR